MVQQVAQGDKYDPSLMQATPSGGNRYIALNTAEPPFDDINIRKAVIANSDRVALRNTRGGELFGPVMNHFIPPLIPGFEEAGGLNAPEGLDFLQNADRRSGAGGQLHEEGRLLRAASARGRSATSRWSATTRPPGKDTATVFQDQLEELGFKVNFQPVEHSLMYTKFCSVPSQQPDVCPNVGWIKDCNDPVCFFDVPWYGPSINPSNNSNWARLDDPEDQQGDRGRPGDHRPGRAGPGVRRAGRPGHVEGRRSSHGSGTTTSSSSRPDVNGVINLFNALYDLNYTSLKRVMSSIT